jgi:surfeit locus 1 family protein
MNFAFSPKVSIITALLAMGMVRASVWQWDRHIQKQALIGELNETLHREPIDLGVLIAQKPDWSCETFRRVKVSGTFDFEREILLRNRNLDGRAGAHVITPLKIDSTGEHVLIDRGFIPLGREGREQRRDYQKPLQSTFFGLIKNSSPKKFLAPSDPPAGAGHPWVDQWIRVDIPNIQAQLPYPLLPIYLETMEDPNDPLLASKIVREGAAGKSDVLMLTGQKSVESFGMESPDANYPLPTYDITPPPDIHLGYVYEWAFMAILTLLIGVVMQLKRPTKPSYSE